MKFAFGVLAVLISYFVMINADKPAACLQPHSVSGTGHFTCDAYRGAYTYISVMDTCIKFIYSGCKGNENRFETMEQCEDMCRPYRIPDE